MTCSTEGDAGDMVYMMGVLRSISGGPHTLLIEDRESNSPSRIMSPWCKRLFDFVGPLASSQEYIKECRVLRESDRVQWRSGDFRRMNMHSYTQTLMRTHLDHLNVSTNVRHEINESDPWLAVDPSSELSGRVVINRTARYQNPAFQWKKIVDLYGHRIVFIGLPHEYVTFCGQFGKVEYRETKTLLEIAQLIAGCSLFIGNQSCAFAVAEGLKHDAIQETNVSIPDCIFGRTNVQHCVDGVCVLPDVTGSGSMTLDVEPVFPDFFNVSLVPPGGGWKFTGLPTETNFDVQQARIAKTEGIPMDDAHRRLLRHNFLLTPEFFTGPPCGQPLANYNVAISNAFRDTQPPASIQK